MEWFEELGFDGNPFSLNPLKTDFSLVGREKEGKEILTAAAAHSPELKIAMETWKEIKFEFDTVDKLDVAHK